VSGQRHVPAALLPGKEPRAGKAPDPVWTLRRTHKSLASAGIQTPDRPARSLSPYVTRHLHMSEFEPLPTEHTRSFMYLHSLCFGGMDRWRALVSAVTDLWVP